MSEMMHALEYAMAVEGAHVESLYEAGEVPSLRRLVDLARMYREVAGELLAAGGVMEQPAWTVEDVEATAQAAMAGQLPPQELLDRFGVHPPHDFLHAIGKRFFELKTAEMQSRGDHAPA